MVSLNFIYAKRTSNRVMRNLQLLSFQLWDIISDNLDTLQASSAGLSPLPVPTGDLAKIHPCQKSPHINKETLHA